MNNYFMWHEKYQPQTLDECILEAFPEHIVKTLKAYDKADKLPNILMYGDAGTGKSTIARILTNKDHFEVNVFDGSMLRKEDIPNIQKRFTFYSLFGKRRVVLIDEADGMTYAAQLALRSVIDPKYEASWIFTGNYRKKIIEPIQSRFMQIECSLPSASDRDRHIAGIVNRCKQILLSEKITGVPDSEIFEIVSNKYPDIRQTINELQLRYAHLSNLAEAA